MGLLPPLAFPLYWVSVYNIYVAIAYYCRIKHKIMAMATHFMITGFLNLKIPEIILTAHVVKTRDALKVAAFALREGQTILKPSQCARTVSQLESILAKAAMVRLPL